MILTTLWATLSASPLFRKIVVVAGIMLAVLLAIAGIRRSGEKTGRLIEREANRVAGEKHEKRVEEVKKQIDAVARPDDSDVTNRLRKGNF